MLGLVPSFGIVIITTIEAAWRKMESIVITTVVMSPVPDTLAARLYGGGEEQRTRREDE